MKEGQAGGKGKGVEELFNEGGRQGRGKIQIEEGRGPSE